MSDTDLAAAVACTGLLILVIVWWLSGWRAERRERRHQARLAEAVAEEAAHAGDDLAPHRTPIGAEPAAGRSGLTSPAAAPPRAGGPAGYKPKPVKIDHRRAGAR